MLEISMRGRGSRRIVLGPALRLSLMFWVQGFEPFCALEDLEQP